jgi:hypothetical protein
MVDEKLMNVDYAAALSPDVTRRYDSDWNVTSPFSYQFLAVEVEASMSMELSYSS